jgi:hypothetical protein
LQLLGNFLLIFAASTAQQRKISLLQKTMFLAQQMGYIVSQKEVGW